jgi:hypothetical protein
MIISSNQIGEVENGIALETHIDGETILTYVVVSPADLNAVADIVPIEKFKSGAEIHATVVNKPGGAWDQVEEVLGNVNPGDIAVFLCSGEDTYDETLDVLGWGESETVFDDEAETDPKPDAEPTPGSPINP